MPNNALHWSGDDTRTPVVGYAQPPVMRDGDPNRPQEFFLGYVRVFDLAKPEDVAAYNLVVDAVCKGVGQICREEVNFSQTTSTYYVYIRWVQRVMADPKQVYANASLNDQQQVVFKR